MPYENVDIDEHPEAIETLKELQDGGQIIPTVVYADGTHEVNPTDEALARRIGLSLEAERAAYDLVIIGGGPAGLAAAIYAAREGIDSIVVDGSALGGQAGISDRIDNYPGFPEGIGGAELAERFVAQAKRYGVELLSAVSVASIAPDGDDLVTTLASGQELTQPCGDRGHRLDLPPPRRPRRGGPDRRRRPLLRHLRRPVLQGRRGAGGHRRRQLGAGGGPSPLGVRRARAGPRPLRAVGLARAAGTGAVGPAVPRSTPASTS